MKDTAPGKQQEMQSWACPQGVSPMVEQAATPDVGRSVPVRLRRTAPFGQQADMHAAESSRHSHGEGLLHIC